MTYNQFSPVNANANANANASGSGSALGVPGAGFGSRGRASGVKQLSVGSTPSIAVVVAPIGDGDGEREAERQGGDEGDKTGNANKANHTPRTSRSHLLAGLRTQPKTPAAQSQSQSAYPYPYASPANALHQHQHQHQHHHMPHTASAATFPATARQYCLGAMHQVSAYPPSAFALPDQVLAPPHNDLNYDDMDPALAQQMLLTEAYLAQRQAQLQEQLYQITAGVQNMNMGMNMGMNMNMLHQNMRPRTANPLPSLYHQQLQNGVSPVVHEISGRPGVYLVYNPMTGQSSLLDAYQNQNQNQNQMSDSMSATPAHSNATFNPDTPPFRTQASPPLDSRTDPLDAHARTISPPKKSSRTPSPPSAFNVTPLPPPSANAFRRAHQKKLSSLAFDDGSFVLNGPKSAFVRPVGFPATPMTGTFGPGNARAGEHPTRQPRGPPAFEELASAPTARHEGSKNFASRQRRGAVRSLVQAGIERRGVGRQSSVDSNAMSVSTPGSETELVFGVASDGEESVVSGSGRLSDKPSFGSLRGSVTSAIGSEMKLHRERKASGGGSSSESLTGLGQDVSALRNRSPVAMHAGSAGKAAGGVY